MVIKKINVLCFLYVCSYLTGQESGRMEFVNKPIEEILFVLAAEAGLQVFPDSTVYGLGSFFTPGWEQQGDPGPLSGEEWSLFVDKFRKKDCQPCVF